MSKIEPLDAKTAIKRDFAIRLRFARENAGYKFKKDFARALGVESETYNSWERGRTEPDIANMVRIIRTANVSADYLLLGKLPTPQTVASSKAN